MRNKRIISGLWILMLLGGSAVSFHSAISTAHIEVAFWIGIRLLFAVMTLGFLGMSNRAVVNEKVLQLVLFSIVMMNFAADQTLWLAR